MGWNTGLIYKKRKDFAEMDSISILPIHLKMKFILKFELIRNLKLK